MCDQLDFSSFSEPINLFPLVCETEKKIPETEIARLHFREKYPNQQNIALKLHEISWNSSDAAIGI